jgi:hypothetical protein
LNKFVENDSLKNLHKSNVIAPRFQIEVLMRCYFSLIDFEPLRRFLRFIRNVMSSQDNNSINCILKSTK